MHGHASSLKKTSLPLSNHPKSRFLQCVILLTWLLYFNVGSHAEGKRLAPSIRNFPWWSSVGSLSFFAPLLLVLVSVACDPLR